MFAPSKEVSHEGQGLTAVEKIFNKNAVGTSGNILHAGSYVRAEVNIVGSQDTTGLMTSQELEMMAATTISPIVDGAYQSGCHTASVWDLKAQENIPRLMTFMNDFGLITGRDPKGEYHAMTDVIHKVLNDLTVDDWAIIIGGDSHTRMSKGVAFGQTLEPSRWRWPLGKRPCPFPNRSKSPSKVKCSPTWTSETLSTPPKLKCSSTLAVKTFSKVASSKCTSEPFPRTRHSPSQIGRQK